MAPPFPPYQPAELHSSHHDAPSPAQSRKEMGFIIHQTCYYDEQERRNQFMEWLKEFARDQLLNSYNNKVGNGAAIIGGLERIVQQNPTFEECEMDELVRYAVVPCMVYDEERGC